MVEGWRSRGRRGLLIVKQRGRRSAAALAAATARLEASGLTLIRPVAGDDAGALILRHRYSVDCVILAGGPDLTHAATPALLDTGLPLGLLPLGAPDALARALAIPADPVAAAPLIA